MDRTANASATQSTAPDNSATFSPAAPPARKRVLSAAEQTAAVADLLGAEGVIGKSQEQKPDTIGERAETVLEGQVRAAPPEAETAQEAPPARKKPGSVHEAIEQLGISPEEFYNLEVGFGDNAPGAKLGQLKDGHAARSQALQEIASKEAAFLERESAIRSRESEIDGLRELMLARLSPETRAQVDQVLADRRGREDAQAALELRRMIPELGDRAYLDGFLQHLEGVGTRHGFRMDEIMAVRDPRMFTVLKELMETRATLERLAKIDPERVKEQPRPMAPQGRGAVDDSAVSRAKRTGKTADQVSAISSILRGR